MAPDSEPGPHPPPDVLGAPATTPPEDLRYVAGVDEAGLGPILGPLTFGYSVLRSPAEAPHLWKLLETVVSNDPKADKDRFIVADSKRVYARNPRGRRRLEKTALGFLALLDESRRPPDCGRTFLFGSPASMAPAPGHLERLPWYGPAAAELPRHQDAGSLELAIERLHREMQRRSVELLDAGVRVRPAAMLNASYDRTGNKSATVWNILRPILRHLWDGFAIHGLRTVVDRQGARSQYGGILAQAFPEARVECVREIDGLSEYRLLERDVEAPRRMLISFAERGEERSFAVALGSCLAKYARELAMDAFNAWFSERDPELAPTAGYTTDGRRWLSDAGRILEREAIPSAHLIRNR